MLPTKALVKEWLLEIAAHTAGFHVIEQREDGSLFSLSYGRATPPIDGNALIISTLDRVSEHPFVRQAAWDLVLIDECLAVQNAAAKRCPSAWRQIEVWALGNRAIWWGNRVGQSGGAIGWGNEWRGAIG